MLAAIAPAAIRRVNGLRRVVTGSRNGVAEWGAARKEGVDPAPLLVLWDSLVPQSRAMAGPSWSRFLSSGAGEGASGGSDGSGKDGKDPKDADGGILEAVREGALKEPVENEALGEAGKAEAAGKWFGFEICD